MITHKEWKEYKKKQNVPDGVHPKVKLGEALDRYHKSKKTDADLKKLETDVNAYIAAAKKATFANAKKVVGYLSNDLNSEIASRQEAAANTPAVKPTLGESNAELYREFIATLTKHHSNLGALAKMVKANPGWFAAGADPATKLKHDKLCEGIQAELNKLFAYCRNGGGEMVDISLASTRVLTDVSSMKQDDLDYQLNECLKKIKETADHLADRF
jgi:hypothetical protein